MPKTQSERMKEYRQRLKLDREKYEEVKRRHREYMRAVRLPIKELPKYEEVEQRHREYMRSVRLPIKELLQGEQDTLGCQSKAAHEKKRKTSTTRMRAYRERLKLDQEKYEEMKKKQREYMQLFRHRLKEQPGHTQEQLRCQWKTECKRKINMTGKITHTRLEGRVLNFDHLLFWVANAKTASSYFVTRFGFEPLAVRQATKERPVVSYAVRLNQVTIVFESPTTAGGNISQGLTAHGDFVKDIAFEVKDLDQLVSRAKEGGAEILKDITEETDSHGVIRYAVLKTYGDNTHTLIDRSKYSGLLLPGYEPAESDVLSKSLPATNFLYIDHVEGNMADGTLEDCVAWYERNLNMHRFWCVDYKHDLVPYSCINSASVTTKDENVLLSLNEAAKGLQPTSKASEFVKALGTSGVEHIALYTDDIVTTMRSLKARGADILSWPPTYYDLIREKLKGSAVKVSETIEELQEQNILIDFDERGYMLQAFTKHLQARPTVFIEILQRRNHRGFGAMNYKWVFEAIKLLDDTKEIKVEVKVEVEGGENNDA